MHQGYRWANLYRNNAHAIDSSDVAPEISSQVSVKLGGDAINSSSSTCNNKSARQCWTSKVFMSPPLWITTGGELCLASLGQSVIVTACLSLLLLCKPA